MTKPSTVEKAKRVRLACGHGTDSNPVALIATNDERREWYRCPKGCGLRTGERVKGQQSR